MAKRFESLRVRYGDFLAATCWCAPPNDGPVTWSFLGSTRKRELELFKLLAAQAAMEMGCPAEYRAVFFWLDCLKADSPHQAAGPLVSYYDGCGGSVTKQYDLVEELYQASAEFCLKLEQKETSGSEKPGAHPRRKGTSAESGSVNIGAAERAPSHTLRASSTNCGT